MIRTTTRHRATAIEVNVMALLMRPLFLSGKLQLIEVMFCAAVYLLDTDPRHKRLACWLAYSRLRVWCNLTANIVARACTGQDLYRSTGSRIGKLRTAL